MEQQNPGRFTEAASFSGRDMGAASGLRTAGVGWSKVRLSSDHVSWDRRQPGDESLLSFALEVVPAWTKLVDQKLGLRRHQQPSPADCAGSISRVPRRRRGRGVSLVVDSNSAFDLASPLLQEAEMSWEKEEAIEVAELTQSSKLDSENREASSTAIVDEDVTDREGLGAQILKRGARWRDVLSRNSVQLLRQLPRLSPEAANTFKHLFSGAVAAAVARTSVAPLERVKVEYIIHDVQTSVPETVSRILQHEGAGGFWKGNAVNILRTAPFKAANFYAFDLYRKAFLKRRGQRDLTNWERIMAGAAAGATATVVCFPLDTVRTRLIARPDQFRGVIDCFYQVITKEGPISLYRGLLPGIVSMAPAGAVFYGVYDLLKAQHLRSVKSRDNFDTASGASAPEPSKQTPSTFGTHHTELGTFRTLLYGGISGICAEATTYPLEVLRRQLQLQGARGIKLGLRETVAQILRQGGPGAFYAGLLPSSMQVIPSAALSYYVYEVCKNVMMVT